MVLFYIDMLTPYMAVFPRCRYRIDYRIDVIEYLKEGNYCHYCRLCKMVSGELSFLVT